MGDAGAIAEWSKALLFREKIIENIKISRVIPLPSLDNRLKKFCFAFSDSQVWTYDRKISYVEMVRVHFLNWRVLQIFSSTSTRIKVYTLKFKFFKRFTTCTTFIFLFKNDHFCHRPAKNFRNEETGFELTTCRMNISEAQFSHDLSMLLSIPILYSWTETLQL